MGARGRDRRGPARSSDTDVAAAGSARRRYRDAAGKGSAVRPSHPARPPTSARLGTAAPQPITEIRSHGRWKATPALTRLTATSAPPSLLAAMHLLEEVAPCPSGDAAAALIKAGLTNTPIHPGGALTLARCYGVSTALRLESGAEGRTTVVGRTTTATPAATYRILTAAGRAGWVDLGRLRADNATSYGRPTDYAILGDARLHRTGEVVVRVDDRGSGLCVLVVRMLTASPRPLTLGELYDGPQRR